MVAYIRSPCFKHFSFSFSFWPTFCKCEGNWHILRPGVCKAVCWVCVRDLLHQAFMESWSFHSSQWPCINTLMLTPTWFFKLRVGLHFVSLNKCTWCLAQLRFGHIWLKTPCPSHALDGDLSFFKSNQISKVTPVEGLNGETKGACASLTSWPVVELKGVVSKSSGVLLLMGLVF